MTSIPIEFKCIRCGHVNRDRHGSAYDIEERCPHCKEHPTFTPEEEKAIHRFYGIPPETFTAIAAWAMENQDISGWPEGKLRDGSDGLAIYEIPPDLASFPRDMDGKDALLLIEVYDKVFELGFKIQDISYYKNYFSKTNQRFIMKVVELHKKQMEWWKNKLGIDDYAVAWIAFIKGLIVGSLITYYINN